MEEKYYTCVDLEYSSNKLNPLLNQLVFFTSPKFNIDIYYKIQADDLILIQTNNLILQYIDIIEDEVRDNAVKRGLLEPNELFYL